MFYSLGALAVLAEGRVLGFDAVQEVVQSYTSSA